MAGGEVEAQPGLGARECGGGVQGQEEKNEGQRSGAVDVGQRSRTAFRFPKPSSAWAMALGSVTQWPSTTNMYS